VQHVTHPPLSIALSEDDGDTWRYVRDLDIPTEPHIKLSHPTVRRLAKANAPVHRDPSKPLCWRHMEKTNHGAE
jgi:hypothetical protein